MFQRVGTEFARRQEPRDSARTAPNPGSPFPAGSDAGGRAGYGTRRARDSRRARRRLSLAAAQRRRSGPSSARAEALGTRQPHHDRRRSNAGDGDSADDPLSCANLVLQQAAAEAIDADDAKPWIIIENGDILAPNWIRASTGTSRPQAWAVSRRSAVCNSPAAPGLSRNRRGA
ncbi:MAG: hypothetical protein EKK44_23700 [Methylobacterium sp.]|nr:MAG: hypothetical protein EKK44_23700 [Methylobacterium sp.]